MGILANTVSLCQFHVIGDLPPEVGRFQWASECLAGHGFQSIDRSSEELSIGWVHLDNGRESEFAAPTAFWRDHYLTFSLRRDQRRIPGAALRGYLEQAQEEFLQAHPGLKRVPKAKREEMKEAVRAALFARLLPTPTVYEAVWDTRRELLSLATLNPRAGELFGDHFRATFEGFRLVPVHPFARAEMVVGEDLREPLRQANRAGSTAVADLIRDNQWLGADFLLWLLYRTLEGVAECRIEGAGPIAAAEGFIAYLNDRLVLLGGGDNGVQKVTVAGPQERFREACMALREGKEIAEATLHLEKGEETWRLTLKGGTFHFASFRSPGVKLERDDQVDPEREREAIFFERMYLVETGLQMFDSLLNAFLRERLAPGWGEREREIRETFASKAG